MSSPKNKKRIFLDYASITPLDSRVSKEISLVQKKTFSNPSALYGEALVAKEIVDKSRQKIADIIHCQKKEIIFTSGGTESNNLAILGLFERFLYKQKFENNFVPHFITTNTEHPSIIEVLKKIEKLGGKVTYLGVDKEGLVSLKEIRESITSNTVLISISYANNEIGVVQPIRDISRIIKDWRQKNETKFPYFHTDACQAALYLSIDVLKIGVDMMTLDGIKIYGPRGSGILYLKSGVEISPVILGGGQENGFRSGTENTASMAGLSLALNVAEKIKNKESKRLTSLRDYAIHKILKTFPGSTLNGSKNFRLPNNINICFPGLDAEFAVISLDVLGIAVSYSSSCRTLKEDSYSYVIENLGKKDCSSSSLRITLGRETTKKDIDVLVTKLKNNVL